jgi:hypothetical protein
LHFESLEQEENLLGLQQLLNFGSGYRTELKRVTGKGAFDTVKRFILGLHISRSDLSAKAMESWGLPDLVRILDIPMTEDVPVEGLEGMQLSCPTKLRELFQRMVDVLNETGRILSRGGV